MPQLNIPRQEKLWQVSYFGEFAGDVSDSFNTDFLSYQGFIIPGERIYPHTTSDDIGTLTVPTDFSFNNSDGSDGYWMVADKVYRSGILGFVSDFAVDVTANSPTGLSDSDMEVLQCNSYGYDEMLVTNKNDLALLKKTTGAAAWLPHFWTNNSVDDTGAATGNINDSQVYTAGTTTPHDNAAFAGTYNASGNKIYIVTIDGAGVPDTFKWSDNGGATYTTTVNCAASVALSNGVTITFNATTGHAVGDSWEFNTRGFNTSYPICLDTFQKLMMVGNNNLLSSIEPQADGTYIVRYPRLTFPSDYYINWVKSTKDKTYIGMANKRDSRLDSLVIEYDVFSELSRVIEIHEGVTIGFIWNNNIYLVDVVGKLREYNGSYFTDFSYFPNALRPLLSSIYLPHRNGIAVMGGRPYFYMPEADGSVPGGVWTYETETKRLYHHTSIAYSTTATKDYGTFSVQSVNIPGALFAIFNCSVGFFFVGAKIYKTNLANLFGVFASFAQPGITVTERRAYIYTSKISSKVIDTRWKHLFIKYNPTLFNQGLKTGTIILKYRMLDPSYIMNNGYQGTWTTATTFTIASASWPTNVATGDEIFVTRGDGAGGAANILTVTGTTTLTITLDEAIVSSPSGNFNFNIVNFQRIPPVLTDNTQTGWQMDIPDNAFSDWIQFKIEIRNNFQLEEALLGYQENLMLDK